MREPVIARVDVTRFLFAFGLVPILLARVDVGQVDPPWAIALDPAWSAWQLVIVAMACALLGLIPGRATHGLAGVALGILAGLAVDLWWLAGFAKPYDQTVVSMLPQAVWQSRMVVASLELLGAAATGFIGGAVVRRLRYDRARTSGRPTRADMGALGLAVVGGPLLALGIALTTASSGLVVPEGAPIQSVLVSSDEISMDPSVLRPGVTRFRCLFDGASHPEPAILVPVPEGAANDDGPAIRNAGYVGACDKLDEAWRWGEVVDLLPGQYAWIQFDQTESRRILSASAVFIVAP